MGRRRENCSSSGRWRRWAVGAATALLVLLAFSTTNTNAAVILTSDKTALQRPDASQDIVVAGGIDGRVYAIHAWTGDVLWMFDSGGPMVDLSNCGIPAASSDKTRDPSAWQSTTTTTSVDVEAVAGEQAGPLATTGSGAALLSQMIPMLDGRLYRMDGRSVHDLEISMVDVINANGPVRLSSEGDDLSDLLLFGEKATKIFSLDTLHGRIQPFLAPQTQPASSAATPHVLFGRAEFKTKAVHARNMSAARCFTISEYFLQFAEQSKCTSVPGDDGEAKGSPSIIVLPKDADSAHPEDDESTIAAYDPWTNKQLWELQIPKFDVISVFGVSANRGASFFKWSIDGPSSTAAQARRTDLVVQGTARAPASTPKAAAQEEPLPQIAHEEVINESKHLVKAVPREMDRAQDQYRLRILDGNYYLENHDDDDGGASPASASSFDRPPSGFPQSKRKRRVFWESMENDGKKGVFITYYHVGAMTFGTLLGCMLIAWGFYVKGLTASGAIKAIDERHYLPAGHVHQLTIEQPGHDKITITSSITRALLLEAAVASGFVPHQLPMLENGDETFVNANNNTTNANANANRAGPSPPIELDPETEALLFEKFSKMVMREAAVALSSSRRLSTANLKQLECDPDSSQASTALTSSSSSLSLLSDSPGSLGLQRHSFLLVDQTSEETPSSTHEPRSTPRSNFTEDNDGRIVPVIEELESSSDMLFETRFEEECDDCEDCEVTDSVLATAVIEDSTTSSAPSAPKSGASWASNDTSDSNVTSSSCSEESSEASSSDDSRRHENELTQGSASGADISNPRKSSNASSASSTTTPNEAEVLFPFVCQSRFANEFVELSALGKGGFGQVMLAENRLDGRQYAIKRVGLHLKNQTSKTLQKFLREVKILALLDHPNIVRYYQAWLEKVEEGALTDMFNGGSEGTSTAPPRNYSMSNLLAPISEMEYSNQLKSAASFYSNGSFGDDDGGIDWERDSADGDTGGDAWREEDLASTSSRLPPLPNQGKLHNIIEPNERVKRGRPAPVPVRATSGDDSSSYSNERCDHWLYIQMQYCAGRNLGDFLALPTRKMELPKLLKIFTQISSAISHVHSCGLIHRDLKPANIFVADTEGDSIKLGDFGLSRYAANVNLATSQTAVEESAAVTNMFLNGGNVAQYSVSKWSVSMSNMSESQDITAGVGTYLYASPEQVAGKKYDAKTDMYSLGMILFELCHERFGTTMERYITLRNARERNFPADFQWREKCPEIMVMLDKLLHPDPTMRPSSAEVVEWSQGQYELSLAQHYHGHQSHAHQRSPLLHGHSFNGSIASLSLDPLPASSAFSLQVVARMDSGSDDSGSSGSGGERRLPNHNLLKEVCDVIAEVSGGRMEIKKCGLHLQDGGAQILDFVLDPHLSEEEKGDNALAAAVSQRQELMDAINKLDGVHTVRLDT